MEKSFGMSRRKVLYPKEIKQLMYGSGDVPNPLDESVEVMDECLEWFLVDLCNQALQNAHGGRLRTTDFLTALAGDPKKAKFPILILGC